MAILKKYKQDPPVKKYTSSAQYKDSTTLHNFSIKGVDNMTAAEHKEADQAFINLKKHLAKSGINGPKPNPATNTFDKPKERSYSVKEAGTKGKGQNIKTTTIKL
jgi:hypothetical protein